MRKPSSSRGLTLVELLVVLAVLAFLFCVGLPALAELNGQLTIRSASTSVAATFHEARMRALFTRSNVGVRWSTQDGSFAFRVYQDGNDNGVLTADIASGADRLIRGPVSLGDRFGKITFSFLPGFAALDPAGQPIGNLNDPFRFGASDIVSFSPDGSCTPGSVYLSDRRGRQHCVRLHPIMSRVQILEYRPGTKSWVRIG